MNAANPPSKPWRRSTQSARAGLGQRSFPAFAKARECRVAEQALAILQERIFGTREKSAVDRRELRELCGADICVAGDAFCQRVGIARIASSKDDVDDACRSALADRCLLIVLSLTDLQCKVDQRDQNRRAADDTADRCPIRQRHVRSARVVAGSAADGVMLAADTERIEVDAIVMFTPNSKAIVRPLTFVHQPSACRRHAMRASMSRNERGSVVVLVVEAAGQSIATALDVVLSDVGNVESWHGCHAALVTAKLDVAST